MPRSRWADRAQPVLSAPTATVPTKSARRNSAMEPHAGESTSAAAAIAPTASVVSSQNASIRACPAAYRPVLRTVDSPAPRMEPAAATNAIGNADPGTEQTERPHLHTRARRQDVSRLAPIRSRDLYRIDQARAVRPRLSSRMIDQPGSAARCHPVILMTAATHGYPHGADTDRRHFRRAARS